MIYRLRILSLGAGVQSTTLLLMSCLGILPRLDAAIFADTGWETVATYLHLEWLKIEAGKHGIPIIVVENGNIREKMLYSVYRGTYDKNQRWASMPCYVDNDGKVGLMRRQCTLEHKIIPIKRQIRKMLGLKPKQHAPKDCVEQWIGISTDETQRIFRRKQSRESVMKYPLIDMWMSRNDCIKWLSDNYGISVPKSSCVGCPYHSNKEWRELKENEFNDAITFDESIREKVGLRGKAYLHRSCVPLSEVDFSTPEERGQTFFEFVKDEKLNLFVNNISISERGD